MVTGSLGQEQFRKAMNQGHSAAWEGRWKEAVDHYNRALQQFPENPPALNSLALAHLELGHYDQALELYQKAAKFSPEDPLPIEKSAEIHSQKGDNAEAVSRSMQAADLYLNMRDADKAINNWTRVIRIDPQHIDAHSRLAQVYERLGRTQQAITEHIAVASLLQHAGHLEEALETGKHALGLDANNSEARQAVELLRSFNTLPKPVRQVGGTGPLKLSKGSPRTTASLRWSDMEEGPNPIEEAKDRALQSLAAMLFDLTPSEEEEQEHVTGGLRSIAKVVADGLLSRGFDEKAITRHLTKAIELQTAEENEAAVEEYKKAISAGLDHPAAHFNLGMLLSEADRLESATRSFQRAFKHAEYGLAARLMVADYLREQGRWQEASTEYLQALCLADAAVVPEEQADTLKKQYDPLIEANSQSEDQVEFERLAKNIRHLLRRPNWRAGVSEARGQLPGAGLNGPRPLADILTQANSGRLVDAIARINRLARDGFLRAAMDETYSALEFAPHYLPLHINMGELMLMSEHSGEATQKFATVARLYSARGESDRATQMYQRIVEISPLDTKARVRLIDQMTAQGKVDEAISQYVELADVYYRLAQLDEARKTYEKALSLAETAESDAAWNVQILHNIADIDLQRLEWQDALAVYERLRNLAPNDETARVNLVQLNLRLGRDSSAQTELDNYLSQLDSRSQGAQVEGFLQKLIEENPTYTLARRRLAEHYQQQGDRKRAIEQWNKVGEMLVQAGDREGAKVAVRAILSMNPPNEERYRQFLQKLSQ